MYIIFTCLIFDDFISNELVVKNIFILNEVMYFCSYLNEVSAQYKKGIFSTFFKKDSLSS